MPNLVFIGIGVARPHGMAPLPGVEQSIAAMRKWADTQGYDSFTVTDAKEPVTALRLAAVFEPCLKKTIDRIIVYFVGHGFLNSPDQIWILSDGPDVNTGRVSRDTLRGSIQTYRPKQISVISDACLEARYFQTGTVAVLNDRPGPRRRVFVDGFFSTLPNLPSFFFRADPGKPDFCLFTSVLVDFLNGEDKRAFQLARGMSEHVTTQTLYFSLPDAVLERGAIQNVDQEPRIEPGFPQGDDIYSTFPIGAGDEPPTPESTDVGSDSVPTSASEEGRPSTDLPHDQHDDQVREWSLLVLDKSILLRLQRMAAVRGSELSALVHYTGSPSTLGFTNIRPLTRFESPIPDPVGGYWQPLLRGESRSFFAFGRRRFRSLLTISWGESRKYVSMIPMFEKLIATVQLQYNESEEGSGCTKLSWAPSYDLASYSDLTIEAWEALTMLTEGRLASSDASGWADKLRVGKHANPMIGIVCAYLYDLVGDSESICRLCHFYVKHRQGIPFDIALLSGGEIKASNGFEGWEVSYQATKVDRTRQREGVPEYLWTSTPKGSGFIAGAAPLVRAGWSRLAAQNNEVLREFASLEGSLAQTPISTVIGQDAVEFAVALLRGLKLIR